VLGGLSQGPAMSAAVASAEFAAHDGASPADAAGSETFEFISFAIGADHYGVDIMAVREIKEWSNATALPKQPDYMRGVLNLRGSIVPILDLRCRFGQGLTTATPMHIVLIVQIADRPIGLLADRVLDIVSCGKSQIQPVPKVVESERVEFLSGLAVTDGEMLALIDLDHLLPATPTDQATSVQQVH
jgi:purine-binding chemotaxis protein CheW